MDFFRVIAAHRLICLFAGIFVSDCLSAQTERRVAEFAWFQSNQSIVEHFSREVTECASRPESEQIKLGRLAFNSPRLLGGQAGRMGLSCASCHPSGGSNSLFFIKQISSEPGTADITHRFLSSAGGDKNFNPKPIPDLSNRPAMTREPRSTPEFSDFMRRLIEVEFDGRPTPEPVFYALLSYLSGLDNKHCSKTEKKLFDQKIQHLVDGLDVIEHALHKGDASLRFVISSQRAQLQEFYGYYGLEPNLKLDTALLENSRRLAELMAAPNRFKLLGEVRIHTRKLVRLLQTNKVESVFNDKFLSVYLENAKQ